MTMYYGYGYVLTVRLPCNIYDYDYVLSVCINRSSPVAIPMAVTMYSLFDSRAISTTMIMY